MKFTRKFLFLSLVMLLVPAMLFAADKEKKNDIKPEATPTPELQNFTGKCTLVGTSRFPVVEFNTCDGQKMSLGGKFIGELKRLNNIKISVTAFAAGKKLGYDHFDVVDYEILEVGGEKPFLGTLVVKEGKTYLKVKDAGLWFNLVGNTKIIEKLTDADGGRAWIIGEFAGGSLRVKKFRILTDK